MLAQIYPFVYKFTPFVYKFTPSLASHQSLSTLIFKDKFERAMGEAISSLLFQPPPPTFIHPSRHIWLETSTGSTIPAFYLDRSAPVTLLFSHGNAEDLGMIYDWFVDLSRVLGVNVMCYDYTGYGKSRGGTGMPSEEVRFQRRPCFRICKGKTLTQTTQRSHVATLTDI